MNQKLTALLPGYQLLLAQLHKIPFSTLVQKVTGLIHRAEQIKASQHFMLFIFTQKNSFAFTRLTYLSVVFVLLLLYLFASPLTGVNADPIAKVIPEIRPAVIKIQDQIAISAVPGFETPLKGYISTRYSRHHQGIDIPAPYGSAVKAAAGGKVVFAGWSNLGYGRLVVIRHAEGFESLYAHLSRIDVVSDQIVETGDVVGGAGATGVATGSHLHLEFHFDGKTINPLTYIRP